MARKNSGCTVLHQNFLELELPTAAFDGIFANASLFHIPSQEIIRVLQELRMALVPDGILFSSNPRGSSVGSVTLEALTNLGVPFQGSEHGIHSIRNTVTGDDALEVISDREMRAYGWCYRLNGVEPDLFPDQVFVQSDADVIDWFFGFAHYKDGNWVTYCTPTQTIRPTYICSRN